MLAMKALSYCLGTSSLRQFKVRSHCKRRDALVETSRGMTVVLRMKSEGQDTWCLKVATDMVHLALGDAARGSPQC